MKKPKPIPKKHYKVFKELVAAQSAMNHAWELIYELHAKLERKESDKK